MPSIITEHELKEAINKKTFIKNGKVENAEGVKYDFCLSGDLLKAKYGKPINMDNIREEEKAGLVIEPGEVVFVLTRETLVLPNDIHAILSPKRKLSHYGILVMGGFCIDPLYNGRLLIGLYNFSSSPFPLLPDKKLIAAMFYKLQEHEIEEFKKPEAAIYEFPDDLVNMMERYRPISIQNLITEFDRIKNNFEELKKEFRGREEWFKKFQASLDEQKKNIEMISNALQQEVVEIDKISEVLKQEMDARKEGDRLLSDQIRDFSKMISDQVKDLSKELYKTAGYAIGIAAVILTLLSYILNK